MKNSLNERVEARELYGRRAGLTGKKTSNCSHGFQIERNPIEIAEPQHVWFIR